jgi:hypothetical protein
MAKSRNSGARARRPLLRNGPKIMFPLQQIATNESLPGNKLLTQDSRDNQHDYRRQLTVRRGVFYAGSLAVIKGSEFVNSRDSVAREFRRQLNI